MSSTSSAVRRVLAGRVLAGLMGLGLVLPAVLRRRLPGEVLIFVAVALALVLAFAVWFAGG